MMFYLLSLFFCPTSPRGGDVPWRSSLACVTVWRYRRLGGRRDTYVTSSRHDMRGKQSLRCVSSWEFWNFLKGFKRKGVPMREWGACRMLQFIVWQVQVLVWFPLWNPPLRWKGMYLQCCQEVRVKSCTKCWLGLCLIGCHLCRGGIMTMF